MRWSVLLLLFGCGRLGFDGVGAEDARVEDARDADVQDVDAPAPCTGPFGAPMPIANVNSAFKEWGGFLTDDKLELYFGSDRASSDIDIFVARRATRDEPFSPPELVAELATVGPEDNAFLEPDGLTMWFDRDYDLYTVTRASRTAPWGTPVPYAALNTAARDVAPALSPDGLSLYFSSDRPGGLGDLDVWVARRSSTSEAFGAAAPLAAGNSDGFDCCAHVSGDGTELWFTTYGLVAGMAVIGKIALDPATGQTFGAAAPMQLASLPGNELDVFATRDGEVIGFSTEAQGEADLWMMERSCP